MNTNGSPTPLHKNQYLEVEIEGLSHEGLGVGRVNGFTLFVKGALPGERIKAKVTKLKKRFGFARLLEVMQESPHRVSAPCSIYQQCGGCQLQHLDYAEQLVQKRLQVLDNLQRIGGLDVDNITVHPTIGMDEPWRYRNKAQVPFGENEAGLVAGFYRQGTHDIIEMEQCLIQHEQNDMVVQKVREVMTQAGITSYSEERHQGILRHVVVKYGFHTDELMIVLITNSKDLLKREQIIAGLRDSFPNLKSLVQNVNMQRTNVIFGNESRVQWGEEYIYDRIGEIRFAISARSFYQVNPIQTKVLYQKALDYAELSGKETVIDAYCGIGTISLFLAQRAKQVLGVEIVPEAIADAKRNARLNRMENVEFAVGEAEKVIPWWYAQGVRADVLVVDPPRKGCDEALLETIGEMKPKRVVYVSCNPSTLARDLGVLEGKGYRTVEVQPVDMFPHTSHVECVVGMERVEK